MGVGGLVWGIVCLFVWDDSVFLVGAFVLVWLF